MNVFFKRKIKLKSISFDFIRELKLGVHLSYNTKYLSGVKLYDNEFTRTYKDTYKELVRMLY